MGSVFLHFLMNGNFFFPGYLLFSGNTFYHEKGKSPYNKIDKRNYKIDLIACTVLRGLFRTQDLVKREIV